jgi:cell division inhibitor SulA
MGTGNAYIAAIAKLSRELVSRSGWPKQELLHLLKLSFKEAACES